MGERFQPAVLTIFANAEDVSASLRENGTPSPFWWQLAEQGASYVEVPPSQAFSLTPRIALAKKSALVDYLRYNAQLDLPGVRGASIPRPRGNDTGPGVSTAERDRRWQELLPAAEFMVRTLCEQHLGVPITFVWDDGRRYFAPRLVAQSPLLPDGRAIREACSSHSQCSFIDLRYVFSRDWAAHRVRFEAADGDHWNARANRMIARTIADFIESQGLLSNAQ